MSGEGRHNTSKRGGLGRFFQALLFSSSCLFIAALLLTRGFGFSEPQPKASLEEYEWAELQAIARSISDASSDEEGMRIAKRFNLCNQDGSLSSNSKTVALSNGKEVAVCIIGIRHDVFPDGSGKTGITFCFTSELTLSPYNDMDNSDGQQGCSLRDLLRSEDFIRSIPVYIRNGLRAVTKPYGDETKGSEDGQLFDSAEKFFPLSVVEYAGESSGISPYDGLGERNAQYQYFKEGLTLDSGACDIWTRTADTSGGNYAYTISSAGDVIAVEQERIRGVAPAFCY